MSNRTFPTDEDRENYRLAEIKDKLKCVQTEIADVIGSHAATALIAHIKTSPHSYLPDAIGRECTIPAKQTQLAHLLILMEIAEKKRSAIGSGGVTNVFGRAAQLKRLEMYSCQARFLIRRIYFANAVLDKSGFEEKPVFYSTQGAMSAIRSDFTDFQDYLQRNQVKQSLCVLENGNLHFRGSGGDCCASNPFRHATIIPSAHFEHRAIEMYELITCLAVFDHSMCDKGNGKITFPAELQEFDE